MSVYRRVINNRDQSFTSLEEQATSSINNNNFNNKVSSSQQITNMAAVSCRDRTSEFQSTIRAFQSRAVPRPPVVNNGNRNRNIEQRTQFMNAAKQIGRDLTSTCVKLEKLTSLAKKRSLFDDKPAEIQELTRVVKEDIQHLNKDIAILQQIGNVNQNQSSKNVQKHSSNVVTSLRCKLQNMSKDFQHVLEVRNENLKHQSVRKEQFVKSGNLTAMSLKAPKLGNMGKSVLLEEQDSGSGSSTVINMDTDAKNQYKQQLLLMDESDNFLRERANAMENIEQTIVDLGQIYQQLATLIKEQDELVQRIDHNVDETETNIIAAHGELLKYFQSITSNRWLIIKIFLVLIAFLLFLSYLQLNMFKQLKINCVKIKSIIKNKTISQLTITTNI